MYLLLVNLLLLANLEKKSNHKELDCFLKAVNDVLEENDLMDEATKDVFALL